MLKTRVSQLEQELAEIKAFLKREDTQPFEAIKAKLYQNEPNPFNTQTKIGFYLSQEARQATLFMYDMNGSPIQKVNLQERGEGAVTFQAGTLKMGMYYSTLIADGKEIDTKRLIIMD